MSLGDLEVANKTQTASNGDDGSQISKSNGAYFSDGGEQTEETLLSSPTVSGSSNTTDEWKFFGWFGYRPKCLQSLLSAKWALFWISLCGALQGKAKQQQLSKLYVSQTKQDDTQRLLLKPLGQNQSKHIS